jgi:hypothetical protein
MRARCIIACAVGIAVSTPFASAASTSDASVKRSFVAGVKALNAGKRGITQADPSKALTACDSLAARMSVARAQQLADHASTARGRVGRLLAIQGFGKLSRSMHERSTFEGLIITDGIDAALADLSYDASANDLDAGRRLIIAAAKQFKLAIRPFPYDHP